MDPVSAGILRSLIYFDPFDYPLTDEQLWRWWFPTHGNGQLATRAAFDQALVGLVQSQRVAKTSDFWHLPGRAGIVATRLERRQPSDQRWRRVRWVTAWLRTVPFIRWVAVCNTVAIHNARPESDIDLFIVTRHGRLWLTRAWVTVLLGVLGVRRHGNKIANRLCLSFFVDETALDLHPLALSPRDEHFALWAEQMVPIIDDGGFTKKFAEQNRWVRAYIPNGFTTGSVPVQSTSFVARAIGFLLRGLVGDWLEGLAQISQRAKMRIATNSAATGAAVVHDTVLKFHEQDRRQEYNDRFRAAVQIAGLERAA